MDVVRRNILRLGGSVELDSTLGKGTCVRVRLPLTLAIMDGMTLECGGELYVLPLASVVESFQAQPGSVRQMPEGPRVVKVRDEWLPVVALSDVTGAPRIDDRGQPMLVLVQAEGRRIALQVGRLVGQQQVVVKNLESNYQRVIGVSGATIMGDGSVALILDVGLLVRGAPAASGAATSSSAPADRIQQEAAVAA
jgi:two-component system chemotaxis sensor kinase CheA